MSRIRTLKPEWVGDEALNRAGLAARVLSAGLILMSDDYGRGPGAIAKIVGEVFAFDMERDPSGTLVMARDAMQSLISIGFVRTYRVRGQSYFEILNWEKHQRVDKPGKPRVPDPSQSAENPPESLPESSGESLEGLAPDLDLDHDHDPDRDHDRDPSREAPARRASPAEIRRTVADASGSVRPPPWPDHAARDPGRMMSVRAMQIVDAAWEKHRGAALGVEMAPGPRNLERAAAVVAWAVKHDPGDWERAAQAAAEAAAQAIGVKAHSAFAVFAAQPGKWLTTERTTPPPLRRNDEFDHDDVETFWANYAKEQENAAQ